MDIHQKRAFDNPVLYSSHHPDGYYKSKFEIDGLMVECFVTLIAPINSQSAMWCAEIAALDRDERRISIRSLSGRTQSYLRHHGCESLDCVGANDLRVIELSDSVRVTRSATQAEFEALNSACTTQVA